MAALIAHRISEFCRGFHISPVAPLPRQALFGARVRLQELPGTWLWDSTGIEWQKWEVKHEPGCKWRRRGIKRIMRRATVC